MSVKDTAETITFYLWDTANSVYKTGDAGNLTLRLQSDGVLSTPAASPVEVDATNMPGAYDIVIAADENDGRRMTLGGVSSTAEVSVIAAHWSNEMDADDLNSIADAALARFASVDTGETEAADGSVAELAMGAAGDPLENLVPGDYTSGTAGHRLGSLTSGSVRMVSPVVRTGTMQVVGSADYTGTYGRSIDWDDDGTWVDLTGFTAKWVGKNRSGETLIKVPAILNHAGPGKQIRLELSDSDASEIVAAAISSYAVWVSTDDDEFPLFYGDVEILDLPYA